MTSIGCNITLSAFVRYLVHMCHCLLYHALIVIVGYVLYIHHNPIETSPSSEMMTHRCVLLEFAFTGEDPFGISLVYFPSEYVMECCKK